MAIPQASRSTRCLALAVAICILIPGCFSNETEPTIFERASQCFDDHNVYKECAEELRLGVEGAFHVGSENVDAYCGGMCLVETKMALQCVEAIADESFRFSNGASVLEVKAALGTGCSYTPERGTFEIRESREYCGGAYHDNSLHMQEQLGHGEQEQYHDQYQDQYQDQHQDQYHDQYQDQHQGGGFSDYCSGAAGSSSRMLFLTIFFAVSAMSMLLAAI
ncbi:hypothetical protein ACQ4PT_036222 [Festuca glaucescens]